MKTQFKLTRKTRSQIRREIIDAGGKVPVQGSKTRMVTRKDLDAALAAARKRSGVISRAIRTRSVADTLASRVQATRPAPSERPAVVCEELQREAALDSAWREYTACENQRERREVYARHKDLLDNAAAIHKASRFAQSTHQKTNQNAHTH